LIKINLALRVQPDFDKAANGLRAGGLVVMSGSGLWMPKCNSAGGARLVSPEKCKQGRDLASIDSTCFIRERVRLSVKKGTAPDVGSFVDLKARLLPPLAPLRPGAYDFSRDLFFQGIGASGFVMGAINTVDAPDSGGLALRYAASAWRPSASVR
jgi:hypothetical protein